MDKKKRLLEIAKELEPTLGEDISHLGEIEQRYIALSTTDYSDTSSIENHIMGYTFDFSEPKSQQERDNE